MTQPPDSNRLLKRRDEVRALLRSRIDEASKIVPTKITSRDELAKAEAREKKWRDYNFLFLSQTFSKQEFAYEYDSSKVDVHLVADRYYDPDFSDFPERLDRSIKRQIECLESIIERIGLLPDPDDAATAETTSDVARGHAALVRLAERFDLVVRQLRKRHDKRSTLDVDDEYDVQDLFHALLTLFFDDIRDEEWTPSYAGGASRTDFLLREIETVVEIKMMRPSLPTNKLGEQLLVDIARYKAHPNCRTLFCVVYDPEGRIENPRGLKDDLERDRIDVRILIVPKR